MAHSNIYRNAQGKIKNMLGKLNSAAHAIIPHLSDSTNGIINKLGIASVLSAGTNAVVTEAVTNSHPTWLTISETVGIVSIVGSGMFVIKLCADVYFARKRDKREQEAHNLKMKGK